MPKPENSATPEGRRDDHVIKKRVAVATKGGAWATLLVVVQLLVGESAKWREEFKAQAAEEAKRDADAAVVTQGMKESVDTLIAESRAQREFLAFIIAGRENRPIPPARVEPRVVGRKP